MKDTKRPWKTSALLLFLGFVAVWCRAQAIEPGRYLISCHEVTGKGQTQASRGYLLTVNRDGTAALEVPSDHLFSGGNWRGNLDASSRVEVHDVVLLQGEKPHEVILNARYTNVLKDKDDSQRENRTVCVLTLSFYRDDGMGTGVEAHLGDPWTALLEARMGRLPEASGGQEQKD